MAAPLLLGLVMRVALAGFALGLHSRCARRNTRRRTPDSDRGSDSSPLDNAPPGGSGGESDGSGGDD